MEVEDVLFATDGQQWNVSSHRNGIASLQMTTQNDNVLIGMAFCDPVLQRLKVTQISDDTMLTKLQVRKLTHRCTFCSLRENSHGSIDSDGENVEHCKIETDVITGASHSNQPERDGHSDQDG